MSAEWMASERWGADGAPGEERAPVAGRNTLTARLPASARAIARAMAHELGGPEAAANDGDDGATGARSDVTADHGIGGGSFLDDLLAPLPGAGSSLLGGNDSGGDDSDTDPEGALAMVAGSRGAALPAALRARFEGGLGEELGGVQVHTGPAAAAAARAVSALAFTTGHDIYFADGAYDPSSADGQALLAHEVVHAVQQGPGAAAAGAGVPMSTPGDAGEHEADDVARGLLAGGSRRGGRPRPRARGLSRRIGPRIQRYRISYQPLHASGSERDIGDQAIIVHAATATDALAGARTRARMPAGGGAIVTDGLTAWVFDGSGVDHGAFQFVRPQTVVAGIYAGGVQTRGTLRQVVHNPAEGDDVNFISSEYSARMAIDFRHGFGGQQAAFDAATHAFTNGYIIVPALEGTAPTERGRRARGGNEQGPRHGAANQPAGTPRPAGPPPPVAPVPGPPRPDGDGRPVREGARPAEHPPAEHAPGAHGAPQEGTTAAGAPAHGSPTPQTGPVPPVPPPGQTAPNHAGHEGDRDQQGSMTGTRLSGAPGQGGERAEGAPSIAMANGFQGDANSRHGTEPAFPAQVLGPTMVPLGSSANFAMSLDMAMAGPGFGETSQRVAGVDYRWQGYHIEDGRELEGTLRQNNGQAAAEADVLSRDRGEHLANDEATPGGQLAADWQHTRANVSRDNHETMAGIGRAVRGGNGATMGQRASGLLANLVSLATAPVSNAVQLAGVGVRALTDAQVSSLSIPFPEAGITVIRCLAQPLGSQRVASVAVRVVRVENIDAVARNAAHQPDRDLSDVSTHLETGTNDNGTAMSAEDRRLAIRRQEDLEAEVHGTTVGVLEQRRRRLVEARDQTRDPRLRALYQGQIEVLERQSDAAVANASGQTFRLRAAFADQDSGQSYPLLLQMNSPGREGDHFLAHVTDVSTPQIVTGDGRSDAVAAGADARAERAAQQTAIWRACEHLGAHLAMGRGRLVVTMPSGDEHAPYQAGAERVFTVAPQDWNLARNRLDDVATAATIVAMVVPGLQVVGMVGGIAGGISAAQRLYNRSATHSFTLSDPATVGDVLSVIGAIASVPGMVGRMRIDRAGGRLTMMVNRVATAAQRVAGVTGAIETATGWAGFAINEGQTLNEMLEVNTRESAGQISHNEAAVARNGHFLSLMQQAAIQVITSTQHGEEGDTRRPPAAGAEAAHAPSAAHAPAADAPVHAGPSRPSEPRSTSTNDPHHRDATVPPEPAAAHDTIPSPPPVHDPADPHHRPTEPPPAHDPDDPQYRTTEPPAPPRPQARDTAPYTSPADAREAARIRQAQIQVATSRTVPHETRVVPDATPDPMPSHWVRVSAFEQHIGALAMLRQDPQGRQAIHGLERRGREITLRPGEGHHATPGGHINVDPTDRPHALDQAIVIVHEADHVARENAAPPPHGHSTFESYRSAYMLHEALAQARALDVAGRLHVQSGGTVAELPNLREVGAREYFPAFQAAWDAYWAANPHGTDRAAWMSARTAGTTALAEAFGHFPTSAPDVPNYEAAARQTYNHYWNRRATNPGAGGAPPAADHPAPRHAGPASDDPARERREVRERDQLIGALSERSELAPADREVLARRLAERRTDDDARGTRLGELHRRPATTNDGEVEHLEQVDRETRGRQRDEDQALRHRQELETAADMDRRATHGRTLSQQRAELAGMEEGATLATSSANQRLAEVRDLSRRLRGEHEQVGQDLAAARTALSQAAATEQPASRQRLDDLIEQHRRLDRRLAGTAEEERALGEWVRRETSHRAVVENRRPPRFQEQAGGPAVQGVHSDSVTKGLHIDASNGIELAVSVEGVALRFDPVFSGEDAGALQAARDQAQAALADPTFRARLLDAARRTRELSRSTRGNLEATATRTAEMQERIIVALGGRP